MALQLTLAPRLGLTQAPVRRTRGRCVGGMLIGAVAGLALVSGCDDVSADVSLDASAPVTAPNANAPETQGSDAGDTPPPSTTSGGVAEPSSASVEPPASSESEPGKTGANFDLPNETEGITQFPFDDTSSTASSVSSTSISTTETGDNTTSSPVSGASETSATDSTTSDSTTSDSSASRSSPDAGETTTDATVGTDSSSDTTTTPTCPVCPSTADPCWVYACNPLSASCELVPNLGAECDDDDKCTTHDMCGADGECNGTAMDCAATNDACTSSACNPSSGQCELQPLPNTTQCDDDDKCTTDDHCDGAGNCGGQVTDCSKLNDQCLTGTCNPDSGTCEALPSHLGDPCQDPSVCTLDDRCQADGSCSGKPKDCSAYDATCVVGQCNAASGACEPRPLDDVACDDASACTANDTCKQGVCTGVIPDSCSSVATLDLRDGSGSLNLDTSCRGVGNQFNVASYLTPVVGSVLDGGDCTQSTGPDVFVQLDLTSFTGKVRVEASTDSPLTLFDTVLILMGSDPASETQCGYSKLTACNDDISLAKAQSRIDVEVAPGAYLLVIDGYLGPNQGPVGLTVKLTQQ